ncbi:MAG: response regulator [Desulfobacteraceae bacterium]|nr:response regulator [Desulfobacteraceae bacterium]
MEEDRIKEVQDRLRILIAEDEKNIGDLLSDLLSQEDREITVVNKGSDAMARLRQARYDLLITDLMMPEADGMEVLSEAKALYPDILVIIMTGYASIETAIQAVKQGAYDYIRKPFRLEEFKISVDNACDKIRLRRENKLLLERVRTSSASSKAEAVKEPVDDKGTSAKMAVFAADWMPSLSYGADGISLKEALNEMERLADFLKKGLIDETEFKALKKGLLNRVA